MGQVWTTEQSLNEHQVVVRDRIVKITSALEHEFGLDGWLLVRHEFSIGVDAEDSETVASTLPSWEYRSALITWYLQAVAMLTDDQIVKTATHEYIHVLIAPIATLIPKGRGVDKLEEYVTESLMRVIGHARGMDNVR
jgi:hypothetical protein